MLRNIQYLQKPRTLVIDWDENKRTEHSVEDLRERFVGDHANLDIVSANYLDQSIVLLFVDGVEVIIDDPSVLLTE